MLIYETFARGNEAYGRPANPDFLLERDELLQVAARGLTVVAFEQGAACRRRSAAPSCSALPPSDPAVRGLRRCRPVDS